MSFGDRHKVHRGDSPETTEFAYRIEFGACGRSVSHTLRHGCGAEEVVAAPILERRLEKAQMMRVFFGERDKWHGEATV